METVVVARWRSGLPGTVYRNVSGGTCRIDAGRLRQSPRGGGGDGKEGGKGSIGVASQREGRGDWWAAGLGAPRLYTRPTRLSAAEDQREGKKLR